MFYIRLLFLSFLIFVFDFNHLYASQLGHKGTNLTGVSLSFFGQFIFSSDIHNIVLRSYRYEDVDDISRGFVDSVEHLSFFLKPGSGGIGGIGFGYDFFNGIAFDISAESIRKTDIEEGSDIDYNPNGTEMETGYTILNFFNGVSFKGIFYYDTLYNLIPFVSIGIGVSYDNNVFLKKGNVQILSALKSTNPIILSGGLNFVLSSRALFGINLSYYYFSTYNLQNLQPSELLNSNVKPTNETVIAYDFNNITHRLFNFGFCLRFFL